MLSTFSPANSGDGGGGAAAFLHLLS